jgi:phosphoglycolate phosphatase
MSRFRTFLFDLDGTLVDHFAAIHRCHAHTMRQLGLRAPTLAEVRAAVGGGLETAISRLVGADRVEEALKIYRPYWDQTMLDDVRLLPGVQELLEQLRAERAQLGVLTNKLGSSSRLICDHLGITAYFTAVIGAKDTPWLKPQAELTRHALTLLKGDAASAVLVGDSPYDVQAARNGGIRSWCVTTGTHNADELRVAGVDAVFANLPELKDALAAQIR